MDPTHPIQPALPARAVERATIAVPTPSPAPPGLTWRSAALLVLTLSLLLPHSWPGRLAVLWVPGIGLGVALVFWFGYRAAWLLLPAGLLASARTALESQDATPWLFLVEGLWSSGLLVLLAITLVGVFRRTVNREVDLLNPHTAIGFLVIPALLIGVFAIMRTLPIWLTSSTGFPLLREILAVWVAHALGFTALTPLLLVFVTPFLMRSGALKSLPLGRGFDPLAEAKIVLRTRRLTRTAWIEIILLAIGTMFLSLLLTLTQNPQQTGSWQLWGTPLLLVVWAGIRQGLHGATLVAASGTIVTLQVLSWRQAELTVPLLIQGNLLAQCATALLVASSVSWVRANEERYRQVVSQVPVVLYSTRVVRQGGGGKPMQAEITFVNPRSASLFDCPPEELLGDYEKWLNRVHPDDCEILRAALSQLARQNQPVTCEYRLAPSPSDRAAPQSPLPEVRHRWVRDVLVPHFDDGGILEGWDGIASDITEQRALADDLRRTTSMFHALVANLPAGVFFVSAKSGRPILVNQRARQLLGQREDAAAGLDRLCEVYRLHLPDGTPYPSSELPVCQVQRRGGTAMRDDIVVYRPDGRRIPLISWAAAVDIGRKGESDSIVWVLEDLTDLRQAEAARRESEGRLRTIIESLAEGLLVQDRHGTILHCNPAGEKLLGKLLDAPDRIAEGHWLREDGGSLEAEEHPIRRVLKAGMPVRNVILGLPGSERPSDVEPSAARARSARTRWLLINSLPLAVRAGSMPAGVVTTFVDLTEQVHSQHLIKASEERYRGLIDSLPLMLLQFDRAMNITLANPAMSGISGYTYEEVRDPEIWQKLIHPEDLSSVLEGFKKCSMGKPVRLETRYRSKDGQEHFCYSFLQPLWSQEERPPGDSEHDVVGMTALVVDLTRERRLEEELQRAQRLELVGRLSSSIAHDFNNLLTALLGLTQLAELKAKEGKPVLEELHHIANVGEQATQLAQQILSFCKQRPVPPRHIDINRATSRITDILQTLLPREVRLECDLDLQPLVILGDEIQLQQVVMNLCLNARDAMPQGGRLAVRTHRQKQWAYLTVEDSGLGMTREVKERIFDPFFSTKEQGTGLGLAVVQQVVTTFGGSLEVQSELGKGSRFEVRLPLIHNDIS